MGSGDPAARLDVEVGDENALWMVVGVGEDDDALAVTGFSKTSPRRAEAE